VKVAFVVNDIHLSGGVGVVVEHARRLRNDHEIDAVLVLARDLPSQWTYEQLATVPVIPLQEARALTFDVAVATWWETVHSTFGLSAARYAYFIQSMEDRFYPREATPERFAAAMTYSLPVAFITEATWIKQILAALRPDAPCYLVRNGVDKHIFEVSEKVDVRLGEPLRILVEGRPSVWFKGVAEALAATSLVRAPNHVTLVVGDREAIPSRGFNRVVGPLPQRELSQLYAETDVLLKLSRVEGMFGPPLEAFHRGATCVVTPVTGHDEYVEHGWNGMVLDWDDPTGTARMLDLLARDRRLLHFLRSNALDTARLWPSTRQSSEVMAAVLQAIVARPATGRRETGLRLASDVRIGVERYRLELRERDELAFTLGAFAWARQVVAKMDSLRQRRWVRILARPVRPLVRRLRRRLLQQNLR
jgi:glycosyltransferase involved in cell wall biosynthesis